MILLAFLSCLLGFFFFVKDQNRFFSIKANHCVFELIVLCVYLLRNCNRFRAVLHAVDSLNVKHELR